MARSPMFRWAVQSFGPRMMMRREARGGQLGARLAIDRKLWDDPFPLYDAMRAQGRLVPGRLISSSASYDVVRDVLRSSSFGVGIGSSDRLSPIARRMLLNSTDPWAVGPAEPPSMLAVDPPDHTRYRRLVSKIFTARAVASLEPKIEKIATELLDAMEERAARGETVDLVDMYCAPLPVKVISTILGVPPHMEMQMLEWGNQAAVTLEIGLRYNEFRRADKALRQIHHWLANHLAEVRDNPGDDLMSQLAVLRDEGEQLNDVELRSTALLVVGAGFETTVNLLGNSVVLFDEHPEQLQTLRDDPSRWENAVDEVLRYESPVQLTVRVAGEDTEVSGLPVQRGRFISLMLAGANRDPEMFAEPQRFDVTRGNARDHLSFSAGIHYCLGASLARMEGVVGLRMLYDRFPGLTIAGQKVRRPLRVLRGYEHLPVRLPVPAKVT